MVQQEKSNINMDKCKKCKSNEYVKAGFVNGKQRCKCKNFGCQIVLDCVVNKVSTKERYIEFGLLKQKMRHF